MRVRRSPEEKILVLEAWFSLGQRLVSGGLEVVQACRAKGMAGLKTEGEQAV